MPSLDSEDFGRDLLAAQERDLKPLLRESGKILDLDHDQTEAVEDFLTLAWVAGLRSGQAQMKARATQSKPNVRAVAIEHFEADFRELMEQSAEALHLGLPGTISIWELLHQAWMAGNRTCEAELMGLYLGMQSDVTAEALEWLEGQGPQGKDQEAD